MYKIIYKNEVEEEIQKVFNGSQKNEVAILGMASIMDKVISIESVLSILKEGQTDLFAYIDPERQMKLMKYCEIKKKIPVVIHTHLYAKKRVSFSPIDKKFIRAFRDVQKKMQWEVNSLFLVYGAGQVELVLIINGKSEKGIINNSINYRGDYL